MNILRSVILISVIFLFTACGASPQKFDQALFVGQWYAKNPYTDNGSFTITTYRPNGTWTMEFKGNEFFADVLDGKWKFKGDKLTRTIDFENRKEILKKQGPQEYTVTALTAETLVMVSGNIIETYRRQ